MQPSTSRGPRGFEGSAGEVSQLCLERRTDQFEFVDPSIVVVENLENSIRGTCICYIISLYYFYFNRFCIEMSTGSEDQDVDAVDDFRREVNNTEGEVEFDGDAGDWKRKYFEVLGKI